MTFVWAHMLTAVLLGLWTLTDATRDSVLDELHWTSTTHPSPLDR